MTSALAKRVPGNGGITPEGHGWARGTKKATTDGPRALASKVDKHRDRNRKHLTEGAPFVLIYTPEYAIIRTIFRLLTR